MHIIWDLLKEDGLTPGIGPLGVNMEDLFHFTEDAGENTKELLQQVTTLLRNRNLQEIKLFKDMILKTIETFS